MSRVTRRSRRDGVRAVPALVAVMLIAACREPAPASSSPAPAATDSAPAAAPPWRVTARGIGALRVGMTMAETAAALGAPVAASATPAECAYVTPPGAPDGVKLMTLGGRVARVDVTSAGVRTEEGAQVGDSEMRVRELYPRAVASPHKYTDGRYLTVIGDASHRLVFETDGERVTRYRSGRLPEVEWVEGCG
jgi:hypothetical protein